jgi:hypothetical protein
MAFTTISNTLIQVGKALKREIFTTVKDNFDDHESRINNVESFGNRVEIYNNEILLGSSFSTLTGLGYFKATSDFTLSSCEIQIFETGSISTGTLEIDIKKNTSPDNTGMASVFSIRPSIDFSGASDFDVSSNQVFNPASDDIEIGDFLRLDVTSLPVGLAKFRLILYGEI